MMNMFWLVLIPVLIFGLIVGSFLNCVIWRANCGESAIKGRSYCPKCRHPLAWFDLVPLASFLALGAKCRYCLAPISWQYPLVELATAAFFALSTFYFAPGIFAGDFNFFTLAKLAGDWTVIAVFVVIFVTDIKWYFIPDTAVAVGVLAALAKLVLEFLGDYRFFGIGYNADWIVGSLLAAIIAALFFLAIFLVSRGKWMGFGDVKFAFLMGLFLGFPAILVGLFFAFWFGAIIGLGMVMLRRKGLSSEIPFGPFLVGGTVVAMFFSHPIIGWYLSIGT